MHQVRTKCVPQLGHVWIDGARICKRSNLYSWPHTNPVFGMQNERPDLGSCPTQPVLYSTRKWIYQRWPYPYRWQIRVFGTILPLQIHLIFYCGERERDEPEVRGDELEVENFELDLGCGGCRRRVCR